MQWRPIGTILLKTLAILLAGALAPIVYWLTNQSEFGQALALRPLRAQWASVDLQTWMIFGLEATQIVIASIIVAIPTAAVARAQPIFVATWLTMAVAMVNFHVAMTLLYAVGAWDRVVGDLLSLSIYFAATWIAAHLVMRKVRVRK